MSREQSNESDVGLTGILIACKLARLAQAARDSMETKFVPEKNSDASRLLEQCKEIDLFLESGCLDFGFNLMIPIIDLIICEFVIAADIILASLDDYGNEDLKKNLTHCLALSTEILGYGKYYFHQYEADDLMLKKSESLPINLLLP